MSKFKRKFKKATNKKDSAMTVAKKALTIAKKVDKRAERKYFNSSYSSPMSYLGFNVFCLTEIAQGDTASLRDGDSVSIDKIKLRFSIYCHNSTIGSTQEAVSCRIVIVQDLQQVQGTAMVGADVFLQANNWNSQYNFPGNVGRFKLLRDITRDITPRAITQATGWVTNGIYSMDTETNFSVEVRPHNKKVSWYGANATNFQKNHIYMFLMSSSADYTVTPYIENQVSFIDS